LLFKLFGSKILSNVETRESIRRWAR